MKVAVFQLASGELEIMVPQGPHLPGESESEYVARKATNVIRELGLPASYTVLDRNELPQRQVRDVQDDTGSTRTGWRLSDHSVRVEEAEVGPDWSNLIPRLLASIPQEDWPPGQVADLRDAVATQNLTAALAVRTVLLRDLDARYHQHVTDTFTTKRIR